MQRQFPRPLKRLVIKIGSSVIATYKMKPRLAHFKMLVQQIAELKQQGVEVIVVSSGAIVLGMGESGLTQRPKDMSALQAMSALGQTVLMGLYQKFFKSHQVLCAQMLLTWDDFSSRKRFVNAKSTLQAISERGMIPIINENDTISTDEIKFGDNDRLSAMVAAMIHADLLVVLSDVEGFYDLSKGEKVIFEEIKKITSEIEGLAQGPATHKKNMSKGGMSAKLEAIKVAVKANIPCVIAHGETDDVIHRIVKGERIGTLFLEKEEKIIARKHWISFGAQPQGMLVIDDGAKKAIQSGGTSLLLPGLVSWDGHFKKNDIVVVKDKSHHEVARGLVAYSDQDLNALKSKKNQQPLIHCDNLVLSER